MPELENKLAAPEGCAPLTCSALDAALANIVNGVPWAFKYQGWQFIHETDDLYLFNIAGDTVKFRRGDFLTTDVTGALRLMSAETINDHYEPVEATMPMKCPHCGSGLLWSEDRGAHCDGCEHYNPDENSGLS